MARTGELQIPGQGTSFGFYRGRVGLSALLRGLNLPRGTAAAIQAFTCRAVPDSLQVSGLRPVYIDIEQGGVNMSPESLMQTVDDKTRVVIVQHTFGIPARVAEIAEFCAATDRVLIEDCCHSVSSTLDGRLVGTFGYGGFTSFEWGKEVIAGVGGAAWVNQTGSVVALEDHWKELHDPGLLVAVRQAAQYRVFRLLYSPERYWTLKRAFGLLSRAKVIESNAVPEGADEVDLAEYERRLHPTAERRVTRSLSKLGSAAARRSAVCEAYRHGIDNPNLKHVVTPTGAQGGWVRYPILAPHKEWLLEEAKRHRVELADWYITPVDPLAADEAEVVGYHAGSCPEAELRASQIVTLPGHGRPDSAHTRRAISLLNSWSST